MRRAVFTKPDRLLARLVMGVDTLLPQELHPQVIYLFCVFDLVQLFELLLYYPFPGRTLPTRSNGILRVNVPAAAASSSSKMAM
jgi:hypothetical protein